MNAWTRSPSCGRLVHIENSIPHIEMDETCAFNLEVMTERLEAQTPPPFPP